MISQGYCGKIYSRSGIARSFHVHAEAGVIDSDYRGNVTVLLENRSKYMPFYVAKGMRIAQIVYEPCVNVRHIKVEAPSSSLRAAGGFGSTGLW